MAELLFPKQQVKAILLKNLQDIFSVDTDYPFFNEEAQTSIIITPIRPVVDVEYKLPHIVIASIGYSTRQETLFNGFDREYYDGSGHFAGYVFSVIAPFSVSLHVVSQVEREAEDLSDRLWGIFYYRYPVQFRASGMFIESVDVSHADLRSLYPKFEYGAAVNIQGKIKIEWVENVTYNAPVFPNKIVVNQTIK